MDPSNLNAFIYVLQHKVEAMEAWASTVHEAVADHADRIDLANRAPTRPSPW